MQLRAALLACLAAIGFAGAVRAQETQTEEMERRAKIIATAPPNAAKVLFGKQQTAAPMSARSIGSFARGCMAGAQALPIDGDTWQVMRLSRNRNWAQPEMVDLLERLSKQGRSVGWNGLLVGDMSQPRGGPMLTGHLSHQIGLDADVWLTPMPSRTLSRNERETMSATNMVNRQWMDVDPSVWTSEHLAIIREAARQREVTRIFVNPAIKTALCRDAGADRGWLSKVRPMWGHNYHFHVRIACPAGDASCKDQDPPGSGDGCGKELTDWLALQHKAIFGPKKEGKPKPERWLTLDDLPAECRQVLVAK
ncbi:penicillin-insensitive murein endopeptidase [Terrarubrum flagellatum]|uniref:penicillin-insensitive murein endopeptidase n=1 Tax=Terrirubrum flagellatum TaxID=2895980 RepID=UPI00314556ED